MEKFKIWKQFQVGGEHTYTVDPEMLDAGRRMLVLRQGKCDGFLSKGGQRGVKGHDAACGNTELGTNNTPEGNIASIVVGSLYEANVVTIWETGTVLSYYVAAETFVDAEVTNTHPDWVAGPGGTMYAIVVCNFLSAAAGWVKAGFDKNWGVEWTQVYDPQEADYIILYRRDGPHSGYAGYTTMPTGLDLGELQDANMPNVAKGKLTIEIGPNYYTLVLASGSKWGITLLQHEMGHAFGLRHELAIRGLDNESGTPLEWEHVPNANSIMVDSIDSTIQGTDVTGLRNLYQVNNGTVIRGKILSNGDIADGQTTLYRVRIRHLPPVRSFTAEVSNEALRQM